MDYKDLKWTLDNFNFYYEGNDTKKFNKLSFEEYNKKNKDLIDNDMILCYNYNILKEKWEKLVDNRISFDILINAELDIIYNELQKSIDYFDFFLWYLNKIHQCYINVDKKLKELSTDTDTTIFLADSDGNIWGCLQPDGSIMQYNYEICGDPNTNQNSIVIESPANEKPSEINACKGENDFERTEYNFC